MSYPATLHALVIEDEEGTKVAYEEIFNRLASQSGGLPFRLAKPLFAFSYEEARQILEESKIFHLVILDLRLPLRLGLPAPEDQELGLELLTRCANRDSFPIPAMLVISAQIGLTDQVRIQQTMHLSFHYGCPLVKGDISFMEEAIRRACREANNYTEVGVHLRTSSGREQYPTLSPRDEDLLRRSVLQAGGCIGLDLNWWQAKPSYDEHQWTKVLMGRFLLDDGGGASRPKFFKLMPTAEAQTAIDCARRVAQKLAHINVIGTVKADSTSLMVTEKVGAQDARPKPLAGALASLSSENVVRIAGQIASQVEQLGGLQSESKPLREILWPNHDAENLANQWNRLRGGVAETTIKDVDPIEVFSAVSGCGKRIRLKIRPIVHGDLHMGNVALDVTDDSVEAYIFDPGACKSDVAGRDIASLEVSAILHQRIPFEIVADICSALYPSPGSPAGPDAGASSAQARNTIEFVTGLRTAARSWNDPWLYALTVFDSVLIQVGGLTTGLSGNYIDDPRCAVYVLAAVTAWYQSLQNDGVEPAV